VKAMILAAGRGERMRPLTDVTPKPLLQAGQHRLIEYHLYKLAEAGIKDVVINVAWLGQKIIDELGRGDKYQLNISYSNEGDHALETAGGIYNALPLLGDQFIVVNGDIWTDFAFSRLMQIDLNDKAHLVLVENPEHHPLGDFAIRDGRLREDVVEKSIPEKFTFSGIGLYAKDFFSESKKGKYPLAPMIRQYIQYDQVSGEVYQGKWFDIGTPERLEALSSFLK